MKLISNKYKTIKIKLFLVIKIHFKLVRLKVWNFLHNKTLLQTIIKIKLTITNTTTNEEFLE